MTKTYHHHLVGRDRDGGVTLERDGDIAIHDGVLTYVYRNVPATEMSEFFDWATNLFCDKDDPSRLRGWHVEGGFDPPEPIPDDDSDEYQSWLDGPYAEALKAWINEDRPTQKECPQR